MFMLYVCINTYHNYALTYDRRHSTLMSYQFPKTIPRMKSDSSDPFHYCQLYISKVLEQHIQTRLLDFVSTKNLLSDNQYGFQKGCSPVIPLLLSIHQWHSYLDKRQVTCTFFVMKKLSTASVPHQALIKTNCVSQPLSFTGSPTTYPIVSNELFSMGGVPHGCQLNQVCTF